MSQKIAWNTLVQVLGKIASTSLGLMITLMLTRYLKPDGYGIFTAVTVFVALFGSLADWGLSLITVREASRDEDQAAQLIGNVLVVRLILAVAATIAVNALIWLSPGIIGQFSGEGVRQLVLIASVLLLASSLKTSFQIIFNVKLKMHNWAISELVTNLVVLAGVFFVITSGKWLIEILWIFNLGNIAAAVVAGILAYRLVPFKPAILSSQTKFLFLEAIPMGTILVLFTVYNRIDTVILAHFKSAAEVGYYGLAYRIFEVLVLGAAYFANSVLPLLSNLAANDRVRMGIIYKKSFVVLFFLGVIVAVVNYLLAPVLPLVLGQEYTGSVRAVQILSLALVMSYFNHLNGYTIIALRKQWWSVRIAVVALALNVIVNFILIPRFSLYGAAFTTFLTEGLIVTMSLFVIKKELGILPEISDLRGTVVELFKKREKFFQ